MNSKASATLLVVFIITILNFILFSSWYKGSLFIDLINSREKFYKNHYLTETLFNFATDFVKQNFKTLNNNTKGPVSYSLTNLIDIINKKTKKSKKHILAELLVYKINNKDNQLAVSVNLYKADNKESVFCISCIIKKKKIFKENLDKKEVQKIFVIKDYTISPDI